ncbi:MAG: hypothetical protein V1867_03280 [Candidatus Falkowbacteria bacterium]
MPEDELDELRDFLIVYPEWVETLCRNYEWIFKNGGKFLMKKKVF